MDLSQRLQKCGYRLTAPRQMIMDVLASTSRHLSAEELYIYAHKTNPSIGIATVYRTLELLARTGAINKFDFGQNKSRYELATDAGSVEYHQHLVCTNCGKVINYPDTDSQGALPRQSQAALEKRYDFYIKQRQVQFFGLCGKCCSKRRKQNAGAEAEGNC